MSYLRKRLLEILEKNEYRHLESSLPLVNRKAIEKAGLTREVENTFQELEGITNQFPADPSSPDAELENAAVYLDDATHFNRYRKATLRSPLYDQLTNFPKDNYIRYCRQFEKECLKAATGEGFWTNSRSEKFFGPSEATGDLGLKGSAQWKYRAFSDFIADLAPLTSGYSVIRIPVYDKLMINNRLLSIKELLLSGQEDNETYISRYLIRKLSKTVSN